MKFVNLLGDITAVGALPRVHLCGWPCSCSSQVLSVTVQQGMLRCSYKRVKGRSHTVEKRKASQPQKPHAEMYHRSGLIIWREQGLLYDAGSAVPLLMS